MQGAIENFFKVFDEAKRVFLNVNFTLTYTTFYRMLIEANGKTILDLRGSDTNILFDNASHMLLNHLRGTIK